MTSASDAKNPHLTEDDIKILVAWMEIPDNFQSVYRTSGKPNVGGKAKITKNLAYAQMAAHLHAKTQKHASLKARNMQQR
ncbi:hypothetical protein F441_10576 [Phytophthora nicotianae CJ01A1]|uniref:Uncharacterized protein n=5 Tax=Phytophthora nicotianae TaxID=4792 RepID=V9EZH0_PHYNI|nr:hypothetical protein F443_10636 [Phytophthora nicotianae P1569]ETK84677.1 hypothetical protein L915_10395 [Phytophthora nicotianae]ETO73292.1 hypothetical protein F444_10734 [Phytophthora nicotianae P1976]ETP14505.1 hypothetical protein F441_10576 [Phytophthora nicotianae CJ01A1]ETP42579.1 hypothetical protein F442_10535 [Phytophthora nicotianae P10297]